MGTLHFKHFRHLIAVCLLCGLALPASAHVSVMHAVGGFQAGFIHPLTGLDHLLAMLAVGIWAAQYRRSVMWVLPVVFPLMMAVGAYLGVVFGAGAAGLPGLEAGIAASVLILGLLIAFAVQLPVAASSVLVAVFALIHGYAHGVELPATGSALTYGIGFVLATALIHCAGIFAANLPRALMRKRFSRVAGAGIAATGLFFLFAAV
ncbi:MAG: HupE/UreJ family protein [Burkholderiales bacterium]|nr:HupE/UreJ family protein [Burkholderiales bacterium]